MEKELELAWEKLERLHGRYSNSSLQAVTFVRYAITFAAEKTKKDQLLLLAALFDDVSKRGSSELMPLITPKFNMQHAQQRVGHQERRKVRRELTARFSRLRKDKLKGEGKGQKMQELTGIQGSKQLTHASEEKRNERVLFSGQNKRTFASLSQSSFNRP